MQLTRIRIFRAITILSLFAAAAATADERVAEADTGHLTTTDGTSVNRNLAASANSRAVEDAIEAVLAANKLDLDIRFISRTSKKVADGR